MVIVTAHPADAATLTTIAIAAKRHWDYPLRWIEAWLPELTITPQFIDEHTVFVALVGDRIVGFYALAFHDDLATLEHLWVLPAYIGQGIGRSLFEHAVRQAAAHRARRLRLTADPNAEGFYLRMGARRIGQKTYTLEGRLRVLPVLTMDIPPQ